MFSTAEVFSLKNISTRRVTLTLMYFLALLTAQASLRLPRATTCGTTFKDHTIDGDQVGKVSGNFLRVKLHVNNNRLRALL